MSHNTTCFWASTRMRVLPAPPLLGTTRSEDAIINMLGVVGQTDDRLVMLGLLD